MTRRRAAVRMALRACGCALALVAIVCGCVSWWYFHREPPPDVRRMLFLGVVYTRHAIRSPRPMVVHAVVVDLHAPGLSFLVTPGVRGSARPLRAETTSGFLDRYRLQVAVNGGYFYPWWSRRPWDYYPHVGDRVVPDGWAASRGVLYSSQPGKRGLPALHIDASNRATIGRPPNAPYNLVSGGRLLMRDGREWPRIPRTPPDPRTAVALDRSKSRLIVVVVDGRQPGYSEGATLSELAHICADLGADAALSLDGGGSSTLVCQDARGRPEVLNCPIDNRIPGRERPVANHLGVYARLMR